MLQAIVGLNVLLRFIFEVVAVVAIFVVGKHAADGMPGLLLGLAAGAAFVLAWGAFASPKARIQLPSAARHAVGAALLLLGAGAFAVEYTPLHGLVLALAVLVNAIFLASVPATAEA